MNVTIVAGEPVRILEYPTQKYLHAVDVLGVLGFNVTHKKYIPSHLLNGDYIPEWAALALLDFRPAIGPVITAVLTRHST